jgi:hypothetical protein
MPGVFPSKRHKSPRFWHFDGMLWIKIVRVAFNSSGRSWPRLR